MDEDPTTKSGKGEFPRIHVKKKLKRKTKKIVIKEGETSLVRWLLVNILLVYIYIYMCQLNIYNVP